MADVHEFILFKFKDGVTREDQTELTKKVGLFLSKYNGFIRREVYYSEPDQRWIDHNVWASMGAATAAGKAPQHPDFTALLNKVDKNSIVFTRCAMLHETKK